MNIAVGCFYGEVNHRACVIRIEFVAVRSNEKALDSRFLQTKLFFVPLDNPFNMPFNCFITMLLAFRSPFAFSIACCQSVSLCSILLLALHDLSSERSGRSRG